MKNVIPLWCWLIILVIISFILLLSGYLIKTPHDAFLSWGLKRLNTTNTNVITVGTSLVRHGFYFDQSFDSFAKTKGLNDIKLIRFTKPLAKPEDIDTVLTTIQSNPNHIKLLLIQLEPYMFYNPKELNYFYTLQNNFHTFIKKISDNLHITTFHSHYETDTNINLYRSSSYEKIKSLLKDKNTLKQFKTPNISSSDHILLKNLQNSGVNIVFIQMNYAKETYQFLLPNHLNQQIQQWISQFQKNTGYPVWQFPSLNASYYTDTAHLNYKGRKLFSTWVISKIKSKGLV
ncbi:MAG: hypothetical protein EP298_07845 [Gammaproteobacteria bacterium]|nr:MAG: hypothetical protein EP298_07845 [Gammaproteobacteria bacterium]UTW43656.1 hypothetical protein KFE69_06080 [bacterium SCSIO 12844]